MHRIVLYTFLIPFILFITIELYIHFFSNYCEPYFDKKEKIIKRKRNTEGVYKTKFTNTGYFKINNEGWNSHRDYFKRNTQRSERQKLRIAIVGHSNIEGLRVPINKTISKVLENELLNEGVETEVYTFAYGGMHLAQAMHVSRYAVREFQPDILIIGTLIDDFWLHSTNKKFFLRLNNDELLGIKEILPHKKHVEAGDSPLSFLYSSKLIKYFDRRTGIGKRLNNYLEKTESIIQDSPEIDDTYMQVKAYNYLISELAKISTMNSGAKIPIFFLKFPQALPSYNYTLQEFENSTRKHNSPLLELLYESHFKVIDLEKCFISNSDIKGQKFDYKNDYHYNADAHKIIALEIFSCMRLYLGKNNLELK